MIIEKMCFYILMEVLKLKNNKGMTLVEVLLSIGILSFVVVSILVGFTQNQVNTARTHGKNTAIYLAESKLEELLKLPASTLAGMTGSEETLDKQGQKFKRNFTIDDLGNNMVRVQVEVAYGKNFPFRVSLTTKRGGN